MKYPLSIKSQTEGKLKVGKRYHANTMCKKTVGAILISEWVELQGDKKIKGAFYDDIKC